MGYSVMVMINITISELEYLSHKLYRITLPCYRATWVITTTKSMRSRSLPLFEFLDSWPP
jgi:hypothetical protein